MIKKKYFRFRIKSKMVLLSKKKKNPHVGKLRFQINPPYTGTPAPCKQAQGHQTDSVDKTAVHVLCDTFYLHFLHVSLSFGA